MVPSDAIVESTPAVNGLGGDREDEPILIPCCQVWPQYLQIIFIKLAKARFIIIPTYLKIKEKVKGNLT
jgi:hypothetical protein